MTPPRWADAGVRPAPPEGMTGRAAGPQLLSVSAAARMLGVSSSSLRAWAAAGRVPHVRTPGGHRRFEVDELVRWLAERGGAPPAASSRAGELVPTRIEPLPAVAVALDRRAEVVVGAFEDELTTGGQAAGRSGGGRRARALAAVESLGRGLAAGDLGDCYAEAEWEGFRTGASGQPGDAVLTEALALRRAVDRVLGPDLQSRPLDRRAVERALDRMAVRVAGGYADGVRCRLRSGTG